MKKLLIIIMMLPGLCLANNSNNAWLPFVGGNLETICRMIWKEYDQQYNTNTILHLRQGAGGEIAIKDMLDSNLNNRSICAGVSFVIYNKYLLQDIRTHGDDLEMLIKAVNFPIVWYGPNRVPAIKTLDEYVTWLKSLRRPINVGIFQGNTRTVAQYLSNTYGIEINVVMFTNGTQMYPSLSDGSLDLAFDTGGAVSVAEQGRFKIVGYTSTGQISRLKSFPNFANGNQELAAIESWFGIAVPKNTDKTYKDLLTKRIGFLIQQEKFRSAAESAVSLVDGLSGQRLQDLIAYQKSVVRRHWK